MALISLKSLSIGSHGRRLNNTMSETYRGMDRIDDILQTTFSNANYAEIKCSYFT